MSRSTADISWKAASIARRQMGRESPQTWMRAVVPIMTWTCSTVAARAGATNSTVSRKALYFMCMMIGAMNNKHVSLSIIFGAILGPLFFIASPEWSILYGGILGGTLAFFIGGDK